MTLKLSFPIFSPPIHHRSSATEIRFSRWHNAGAEPFLRSQRAQEEIERDLRLHRRFQSLSNLSQNPNPNRNPNTDPQSSPSTVDFKSKGTPSSPSSPSIPGKRSKYSKPNPFHNPHPAFRRPPKPRFSPNPNSAEGIAITDRGIAYKVKDAPFEFQYSYTETPKVKPLALREQPYLPFGPVTMPRPWTGRKPLPESKKTLPEFDSFKLPPAGKKGVKPVQRPGPFLMGMAPKYTAMTREEVLGEDLTSQEVKELVKGCLKTRRQLNMGRDGLTHNMLENIHAHWKRRRVCKIKCKGVCTVDMDNVCQQLEEKTGGKIIYSKGGVIFLFRGRNYNYRTRPRYPLMLWKPVTPVYPRLVQRAPDGLTLEEASEMRKKGRQLPPICRPGKNGMYSNLVKNVREAFEACELVRINGQDLIKSDCRKIGAKLKDLVPCVLVSFEYEHILMWRGKDWKSSLPPPEADDSTTTSPSVSDLEVRESVELISEENVIQTDLDLSVNGLSVVEETEDSDGIKNNGECLDGIKLLLRQAVESGSAVILDGEVPLDANIVYERAVALAKSAPPGPIFQSRIKKVFARKLKKEKIENYEEGGVEDEAIAIPEGKKNIRSRKKGDLREVFSEVVPRGSLGVDELAKLLA